MTDDEIMTLLRNSQTVLTFAREFEARVIERCAEVCDGQAQRWPYMPGSAKDCAAAIRALAKGEK